MFMDPYGPQPIYVLYGHIFLIILYIFPYFFQKDIITPHNIDNHMTDFLHHHSIMYVLVINLY